MAKFVLEKNEEIKDYIEDTLVIVEDQEYEHLSVFFTNTRLVILKDFSKDNNYFLQGRGIGFPSEFEIVLEEDVNNIKDVKYEDDFFKITLNNDKLIEVYGINWEESFK